MRIAFIGGGNMGSAIMASVLSRGVAKPGDVTVSDISEGRRNYLAEKYGVKVTASNTAASKDCDIVVLAIKPQHLAEAMIGLNNQLKPGQLLLSIIAGARIDNLKAGLHHQRIVRAMPNTPAQIGEGITVWVTTPEVSNEQKGWARAILDVMGKQIYVSDEKYLDMATAVSGSGPAYVFLFMESLISAAEGIGLTPDMARELAFATVTGSAHFAEQSEKTLEELRVMVTSPGGTTAEALACFREGGFAELIGKAVVAAYNKAKILGK